MKSLVLLCLMFLLFNSVYSYSGDTAKHGAKDCKCYALLGGEPEKLYNPIGAKVDTLNDRNAWTGCLNLSSGCPHKDSITYFELSLPVGGVCKTFISFSNCMTFEMTDEIRKLKNGGYFTIQNVRVILPDGRRNSIPGKTYYYPKSKQ